MWCINKRAVQKVLYLFWLAASPSTESITSTCSPVLWLLPLFIESPMCRIQRPPGAIDENSRRDSGDEVYPAPPAARYTLWMETANNVDASGPSAQTAPVLCVAGCRKEIPPDKEISPAGCDRLFSRSLWSRERLTLSGTTGFVYRPTWSAGRYPCTPAMLWKS